MPDENCRHLLDYIPFMGLVAGRPHMATPLTTRLFETAIMSAVAGAFATYIGVEVLKSDIQYIKQSISEVKQKVDEVDNKVERVRSDLYVPLGRKAEHAGHT